MTRLRNTTSCILILCSLALFKMPVSVWSRDDSPSMFAAKPQTEKKWRVTYRVDEGNKRGKSQVKTISATTSAQAKELLRTEVPGAVVISCTEVITR